MRALWLRMEMSSRRRGRGWHQTQIYSSSITFNKRISHFSSARLPEDVAEGRAKNWNRCSSSFAEKGKQFGEWQIVKALLSLAHWIRNRRRALRVERSAHFELLLVKCSNANIGTRQRAKNTVENFSDCERHTYGTRMENGKRLQRDPMAMELSKGCRNFPPELRAIFHSTETESSAGETCKVIWRNEIQEFQPPVPVSLGGTQKPVGIKFAKLETFEYLGSRPIVNSSHSEWWSIWIFSLNCWFVNSLFQPNTTFGILFVFSGAAAGCVRARRPPGRASIQEFTCSSRINNFRGQGEYPRVNFPFGLCGGHYASSGRSASLIYWANARNLQRLPVHCFLSRCSAYHRLPTDKPQRSKATFWISRRF